MSKQFEIQRIAAFSHEGEGGNPAGVVLADRLPEPSEMLRVAYDVGYSETAFLAPIEGGFRIRYFAPEVEVPFCGHATIASGAALGEAHGPGTYGLQLNEGEISVEVGRGAAGAWAVTLQSPPTSTAEVPDAWLGEVMEHFGLHQRDIHPDFPVRFASAGAKHLVLVLREGGRLAEMDYAFEPVRTLMEARDVVTISLIVHETDRLFHARNAFAYGGVVEDPATGAAAAAFAGYLRDLRESGPGEFTILQGHDMGCPSRLAVRYGETPGEGVFVTGETRRIEA